MNRTVPVLLAIGVALAVVAGLTLSSRTPAPPPPASPASGTPPATPTPDASPGAGAPPAVEPDPEAPLTPSPADAAERATWEERLIAVDALLVEQAVAAGCDAERADVMRQILADQREARAQTTADFEAGRIDGDELAARATAAKETCDAALAELLQPDELAALDPGAARAEITARDHETE